MSETRNKTEKLDNNWYLYLVRTASGSLYCGVSNDVQRRFTEHQQGTKGARSLRGKGPLILAYQQLVGSRSDAQKVEYRVKQLPKAEKEKLVRGERLLPLAEAAS